MATTSEVKAGLNDIAASIRAERAAAKQAKARITQGKTTLNGLPTTFAGVIAEINGYASDTTNEFEAGAKAELALLTTEFNALVSDLTDAETDLAVYDEF